MKLLKTIGYSTVLGLLALSATAPAGASPANFEWSSTTGYMFSRDREAIEAITGQTAEEIPGGRWRVQGHIEGAFTYDPAVADPPQFFGQFAHHLGALAAPTATLFAAAGPLGTVAADTGRVIVSYAGASPAQTTDLVNANVCCGTWFSRGPWQATGASVVWNGDGFQHDFDLPAALPPVNAPEPLAVFTFFNPYRPPETQNVSIIAVRVDFHPAMLAVHIDVKPGSDPNCFNVDGNGVIPVAILGGADFDVAMIDQGSLSFGGLAVRVRGNKYPQCNGEDVNSDGYLDLVCQFQDDSSAWTSGSDEASLTGTLLDGAEFGGSDEICMVP